MKRITRMIRSTRRAGLVVVGMGMILIASILGSREGRGFLKKSPSFANSFGVDVAYADVPGGDSAGSGGDSGDSGGAGGGSDSGGAGGGSDSGGSGSSGG